MWVAGSAQGVGTSHAFVARGVADLEDVVEPGCRTGTVWKGSTAAVTGKAGVRTEWIASLAFGVGTLFAVVCGEYQNVEDVVVVGERTIAIHASSVQTATGHTVIRVHWVARFALRVRALSAVPGSAVESIEYIREAG